MLEETVSNWVVVQNIVRYSLPVSNVLCAAVA
jgi:hypothetical protein